MNLKFALMLLLGLLVAASDVQMACDEDSDCQNLNSCKDGECEHKDLFGLEVIEVFGTIIILIFCAMANSAGIGGGPLMVPILIIMLGFNTHFAVPLTQIIKFGGSLIAIVLKFKKRHPTKDRPLIYYELIMHVQSPVLLGATYGVMLNKIFPSWIILSCLLLLLIYLAYDSGKRGRGLYKKETEHKNEVKSEIGTASRGDNEYPEENDAEYSESFGLKKAEESPSENAKLTKLLKEESATLPPKKFAVIFAIYVIVVAVSFMMGGKGVDSMIGIENCSGTYFGFLVGLTVVLIGIDILTGWMLIRLTKFREECNYEYDSGDLHWDLKKTVIVGTVGFIAGLGAGLLGIGVGLVMNPVMLRMGVRPEVAAASSSFMILFAASFATIQYFEAGMVDPAYGLWLLVTAFIGSAIGIFSLTKLVQKYDRASLLVILLSVLLCLAAVMILTYGIIDTVDKESKGTAEYGFSEFC